MAVEFDHHARERSPDLRVLQLVFGRSRAPVGLPPPPTFFTTVSNSTSRIWALPVSARSTALVGLLSRLLGRLPRPLRDLDSQSVGFGFGQLRRRPISGAPRPRPGCASLPGALQGNGLFLFQAGVPRVFLLRKNQVGRGGFESGLGLLDPMLDFVFG